MPEIEVTEQVHLLQQELALTAVTLKTMQRDSRAAFDALRLDIEVLQRCLLQLHPELAQQYSATRAQLIREIDPEAV